MKIKDREFTLKTITGGLLALPIALPLALFYLVLSILHLVFHCFEIICKVLVDFVDDSMWTYHNFHKELFSWFYKQKENNNE